MMNYNVHNIIKVKSNVKVLPSYFEVDHINEPDLTIKMGNFDLNPEHLKTDFKYNRNKRISFLEEKQLVENLIGEKTVVKVLCPRYDLFHIVRRSLRELFGITVQYKLIKKGAILIHSACLEKDDEGILLVAPPETGKTSALMQLMKHDFNFLSDDMTLVTDLNAYCWPTPMTIESYHVRTHNLNLSKIERFQTMTTRKLFGIPFFGYAFFYGFLGIDEPRINVNKIYPNLTKKTKIEKIFFLEDGPKHIGEIDSDLALKKIISAGTMHGRWYESEFIRSYAYKYPSLDFQKLRETELKIFKNVINAQCFTVRCRDRRFDELILNLY